jgi:CHASE3 domain sensor protein
VKIERILGLVEIVLHMQQLGAESLVSYYPPIGSSPSVLDSILFGNKGSRWDEAWRDVESALVEEGEIKIERVGKRKFQVSGSDPFLEVHQTLQFELQKGQKQSELPELFAHQRLHSHIYELEEDLVAAQQLKGTLGSSVGSHERVISRLSTGVDTPNVLFQIAFPSLERVPIKELISLRLHEGDAFMAFRQALTKAVEGMITNNQCTDTEAVAAEILRDIVEPELARLQQQLRSAQHALARKVVASLALAGVSTVCGLQIGMNPFAAGAAGLLMSGAGNAVSKYEDEKQAIEMSDMFFLWKALQHAR